MLTGQSYEDPLGTRSTLQKLLDVVAADSADLVESLETLREDWLGRREAARFFDWRNYFVKYDAMRDGTPSIYINVNRPGESGVHLLGDLESGQVRQRGIRPSRVSGAVRMVTEIRSDHESEWAAMSKVAEPLGVGTPETVRKWCRQAQVDAGKRLGVTSEEAAELKRLEAGERRAQARQRDSAQRLGFLRGRARPATALIVQYIDSVAGNRDGDGLRWGVESICAQLNELGAKIAPSIYYELLAYTATLMSPCGPNDDEPFPSVG